MKDISLEEIKSIELAILNYFDDICKKNNLKYFLAYGTLLGAVRHHGFIPWDDDIDVFMPRKDYNKLVEILKNDSHEFFKLVSYEINKDFTSPLPKIIDSRTILIQNYSFIEKVDLGIYIDIFILDGLGTSYTDAVQFYQEGYKNLIGWYRADSKIFPPDSNNFLKDIIKGLRNAFYKFNGISYYLNKIAKHGNEISFYDSNFVAQMSITENIDISRKIWKKELFDEIVLLPFEGCFYPAPKKYNDLLSVFYGDFMQLPPKEKQVSNHDFKVYWK